MYRAYCRQSAVMLYFLSATGSTLWHGSSIDTRKDLKISTCGLLEPALPGVGVAEELDEMEGVTEGVGMIVLVEERFEFREPPESGGSCWRDRSVCEL